MTGASPDLAVSEVDCNLDGMRVGSVTTGEIGPLSSVQLDIIWHPTIPGQVQSEFLVTFADTQATSVSKSSCIKLMYRVSPRSPPPKKKKMHAHCVY